MNAVIFTLPCSDIILQYAVRYCCVEAKVLSIRQHAYQNIFVVVLFLFLIIGSDELHLSNMICFSNLLVLTT